MLVGGVRLTLSDDRPIDPSYYAVADGDKQTKATREASMCVAAQDLPHSAAHPFYTRLIRSSKSMASTTSSKAPASDSTLTRPAGTAARTSFDDFRTRHRDAEACGPGAPRS